MNIDDRLVAALIRDTDTALVKDHHVFLGNASDKVDEGDHADYLEEAQAIWPF